MLAPNLADVSTRACPSHEVLLTLDGKLFVDSCEVIVTEHQDREAAKAYVAEVLAGNDLELAS